MAQNVVLNGSKRKGGGLLGPVNVATVRNASQVIFSLVLLYAGWRFFWFVRHFESGGKTTFVDRPASVEAFLPISALIALKSWIFSGQFDAVHPAGLTILIAILLVSLLWRKGFCSWICPIGALSEVLGRLGRMAWGAPSQLPKVFDWALMSVKYLVLFFFVQAILIGMSPTEAALFLDSPYNKIADVKMLHFFTQIGSGALVVIGLLMAFSTIVSNLWCRYFCPYGALLGLTGLISPTKVSRKEERCTGCQLCTLACSNNIDVARANSVISPECSGCLNCVAACPRKGALNVEVAGHLSISPFTFGALLLATFLVVLAIGQVSAHWLTNLTYADYADLIPRSAEFSH